MDPWPPRSTVMNPDDFGCLRSVMVPDSNIGTDCADPPCCCWPADTRSGHRIFAWSQNSETGIPAMARPLTVESSSATNLKQVSRCISVNIAFQLDTVTLKLRTWSTHSLVSRKTFVIAEQSIGSRNDYGLKLGAARAIRRAGVRSAGASDLVSSD